MLCPSRKAKGMGAGGTSGESAPAARIARRLGTEEGRMPNNPADRIIAEIFDLQQALDEPCCSDAAASLLKSCIDRRREFLDSISEFECLEQ